MHDILGNAARHVRTAAVHLRGVFARQCSATDPADATVGVTRQFSAGHATVGVRASDNKSAGRVDQLLEVPIQTVLTSGQYHHGFDDMAEIADLHIGAVLYRAEEGGNAAGIVVEADLRFGIGAEHLAGMVFKQFQKLGRYHEGKRHHLRSLVGGITVHDALISCPILVHTERNIRRLFGYQNADIHTLLYASTQSVVPDSPQHIICQLAVIRLVLAGHLSGDKKLTVFHHALNRNAAVFVVLEAVGHDGIRNLIADFIGMPVGYLFTGDDFAHRFFLAFM